jgi:hypothetical protein
LGGECFANFGKDNAFHQPENAQRFVSMPSGQNRRPLSSLYSQAPATAYRTATFIVLLDGYGYDFICSFTFMELLKFDLNLRSILENGGEFSLKILDAIG